MKKLILTSLMISSMIANAKGRTPTSKLECAFNEPFFSLTIDLVKKEVTKVEPNWQDEARTTIETIVAKGIQVKADLSDPFLPRYQILAADGSVIAKLVLNVKGSDTMSDRVYPFEIKYQDMLSGCTSDKINAIEQAY